MKKRIGQWLWINPNGKVYSVPYMGHLKFALKKYKGCDCEEQLQYDGWVKCGTGCMGPYIFAKKKPCEETVFKLFEWAKTYKENNSTEKTLQEFCERWDI